MNKALPLLAVALLISGCIYTNVVTPRAYRSSAPLDVKTTPSDPVVRGEACNQGLLWMFAWGRAGYADAVKDALREHPDGILYDVRTDIKIKSYLLALYTKQCTVVSGKVGHL